MFTAFVNLSLGNGLLSDSPKPLSEIMLSYPQRCSVPFTWEQFHNNSPLTWSVTCVWNCFLQLLSHLPRGNELKAAVLYLSVHLIVYLSEVSCQNILEKRTDCFKQFFLYYYCRCQVKYFCQVEYFLLQYTRHNNHSLMTKKHKVQSRSGSAHYYTHNKRTDNTVISTVG